MRTHSAKRGGFTLVEIMIVVAIIGLLAAVAIPNFVKARAYSQKNACISNLRQIFGAKETWALEFKQPATAVPNPADIYGSTLYIREEPKCPANGVYDILAVNVKPICNIDGHSL